jgi:hypothetical protein
MPEPLIEIRQSRIDFQQGPYCVIGLHDKKMLVTSMMVTPDCNFCDFFSWQTGMIVAFSYPRIITS